MLCKKAASLVSMFSVVVTLNIAFICSTAFATPAGPSGPPAGPPTAGGNNFGAIAANIVSSIEFLPGLLTGLAYLMGILIGVKAIIMMNKHVESPQQNPLSAAVIHLAVGGALFALPIVFEAMYETIGVSGASVAAATLTEVAFNLN